MNLNQLKSIAFVLMAVIAVACATKKEESANTETSEKEWKEMDDFHMIMAETFHPYKDSANLEPAKTRVSELVTSAEKWASASLPEKVNTDEMKGKLEQLKNETAAFAETVKTASDTTIAESLTKLHDLFHSIQEDWYNGTGEKHEHEH